MFGPNSQSRPSIGRMPVANGASRRRHNFLIVCTAEVSNPRLGFGISGPIADEIRGQHTVVAMSQWSVNCHLINEMSFVDDDQIQEGRSLARAVSASVQSRAQSSDRRLIVGFAFWTLTARPKIFCTVDGEERKMDVRHRNTRLKEQSNWHDGAHARSFSEDSPLDIVIHPFHFRIDTDAETPTGQDEVHPGSVKEISFTLVTHSYLVFRQTSNEDQLSSTGNEGIVTPIHGTGDRISAGACKHISLTYAPCKAMERFLKRRTG
ncbi:hypothetical protein CLF_113164 [Clonorchis sinensis]|uniref:Uncharacterized protein n=1 Tax=Clonorchis sinensis TaxID=79923 RepID=G7YXS8_CLOSI|nr:hypothetical protein CLF_113164 [Clonorchis sinensis]